MDFAWIEEHHELLLTGLYTTLQLLLLAGTLGFALAIVVGFGRISRQPFIAWLSLSFTNLIRGTPLLVQIFLLYYGLGSVFSSFPALQESALWPYLSEGFWYVALALILSVGAYVGEVIKGGLRGVPKGEIEACYAYGMSRWLTIRRVWLPRALYILLPTLAGETVLLLKSTALASTVAVMDTLGAANFIRSQTMRTYEPLLMVAVVYFITAWLIEQGFKKLEHRLPVRDSI